MKNIIMMNKIIYFLLVFTTVSIAQWQNTFTSSQISYDKLAGWINFEKNESVWLKRMYTLDSTQFIIYANDLSTPEYSYNFTPSEILAGLQLYSVSADLNSDGKADFYVLSYHGTGDFRQSFKIFDITTGQIIFEKNDPAFYFSYPTIADINGDNILECIVTKFNYPLFDSYSFEIYSTGTSGFDPVPVPVKFGLMQNFPNPFNPSTIITFTLDKSAHTELKIFNVQGEEIRVLKNETTPAGTHELVWDGTNNSGYMQPSGVYFYQLRCNQSNQSKKMILLK